MKALLVVAFKDYQDQEYSYTRKGIEDQGIEVEIASTEKGKAQGKFGDSVVVDWVLSEVDINKYAAIIFIGGVGAIKYFENQKILDLAESAYKADKMVAAICCAPMILKRAGILNSKKVTVYPDPEWVTEISKDSEYLDENVVVDGKIITASGPQAAIEFGEIIAKYLTK
ncbi:MAG: DJ-1/PfpI family protein [Parcubacteria group bacterium]|nr:DJ-1/PfpI family protein [Parcubacteria group bacterium]